MKNFEMKMFYLFVIIFASCINITCPMQLRKDSKSQHIVIDNGSSGLALNTVVRRNPIVTMVHSTAPLRSADSSTVNFSNSNTNNASVPFGKTAEIVSKIYIHNN
jgi:hypothetical protein